MGYCFKVDHGTDKYMIHRSPHTGTWGLYKRNTAYGYFAAMGYYGEDLGFDEAIQIANAIGVAPHVVIETIEKQVQEGVPHSMGPRPGFELSMNLLV